MRAEGIVISGGIVRARQKYDYFKRLRMNTKPSHGPFHYAAPARGLIKAMESEYGEVNGRWYDYKGDEIPW